MDARDTERLEEAFWQRNILESHNHIIVGSPEGKEVVEFVAIELGAAEMPDALKITRVLNALSQANLLYREKDDQLRFGVAYGARQAQYTHEIFPGYILLRDVNYIPPENTD